MAEPGEFSRRALQNGRLDLAQVEGLADLIDAETEAQRQQAVRVLSGDLGRLAEGWRRRLINALALVEVTIDFSDEEVPGEVPQEVVLGLVQLGGEMEQAADGSAIAERIRLGFEVAIVGPPNIGKSTLLNRLVGRKAALTSAIPGTTRDVIEVRLELAGLPVTVLDTAGLRDGGDEIEVAGIALGRGRADLADLRVHLVDETLTSGLDVRHGDIVVRGKADLAGSHGVSGLTGEGVDRLVAEIAERLGARTAGAGGAVRERQAAAMRRAGRAYSGWCCHAGRVGRRGTGCRGIAPCHPGG